MSQERRLMRKMQRGGNCAAPGYPLPQWTPQDEQDGKRDRLAERLLEIAVDTLNPYDFSDTAVVVIAGSDEPSPQVTVTEWHRKLAHAALAAAEVIYPEIPEAGEAQRRHDLGLPVDVPAPAITGAEAILGKAVDAYLTIAPRPSEEGEV